MHVRCRKIPFCVIVGVLTIVFAILIVYFLLDPKKEGYIRRFGNTSSSHATLIAARCEDRYALSVKGAKMVFGSSPEIYKDVKYISDITSSKEYKKYLASIAFEGGK